MRKCQEWARLVQRRRSVLLVLNAFLAVLFLIPGAAWAETPGEHFRKAIAKIEKDCASRKLDRGEVCGEVAKLKPADPLTTEEGRFAHSIKIPNPVPEDSGYRPGMTPEEYFAHLCKTEAGEFIYKTIENVEGIYMMRPRKGATDYELEHLYALEDPYGHENWEATEPAGIFVHPERYRFLEMPITESREPAWRMDYVHPSLMAVPPLSARVQRYFGYDGHSQKSLQKEYDVNRKSRYGYTWRGIKRTQDRELGIAGGELLVLDLETREVLAVKRGYVRSGTVKNNLTGIWWLGGQVCKNDRIDLKRSYEFISLVLHPSNLNGKDPSNGTR